MRLICFKYSSSEASRVHTSFIVDTRARIYGILRYTHETYLNQYRLYEVKEGQGCVTIH